MGAPCTNSANDIGRELMALHVAAGFLAGFGLALLIMR